MDNNITDKQLKLLHHTLGVKPDSRVSHRNYFLAGPGHHDESDLETLVAAGLMRKGPAPTFCEIGDVVYRATDAGFRHAMDNLPLAPKLSKYDQYLKEDMGFSFAEWLGVVLPKCETDYRQTNREVTARFEKFYRYVRTRHLGGWDTEEVVGDWKPTMKAAKASYKEKLAQFNKTWRAARKEAV